MVDLDSRELIHKTPHVKNYYFDFSPSVKEARTNPYVISWNLGDNEPFIGKLLRTSKNLANIMHINPTTNQSHRTLLSPCTRCIYHNPRTKIPPQTKDSNNRCFFTIPRDLCFIIPSLRNNSMEQFP